MGSGLVYGAVGLVWIWYLATRIRRSRVDRVESDESSVPRRLVRSARTRRTGPPPLGDGAAAVVVQVGPTRRRARRDAARRRRISLLVLMILGIAVGGAAAFGIVPDPAVTVAPVLIVLFLVAGQRSVARGRAEDAHRALAEAGRYPSADEPSWSGVPYVDVVAAWSREPAAVGTVAAGTVAVGTVAPGDAGAVAGLPSRAGSRREVAVAAEPDERSWRPVPVPLPTYVTAPRVARTVSTVDLNSTGAWTSGRAAPVQLALPAGTGEHGARSDSAETATLPTGSSADAPVTSGGEGDGESTQAIHRAAAG